MAEHAIRVNRLGKTYKVFNRPLDRIRQLFTRKTLHESYVALSDINFEVFKGETVGIIGMNGSGKSTLLQIISGVLTQSEGHVEVNGRIAALLELGAGFNPEFTGRENIYLSGSLLGITKDEIDQKFDQILEFSGIGRYIEQPVKTYSSGMYVRLAFSVAINVNPDILIVDEALAVGDMLFQAKCMHKMRDMISQGVTILFVSHDISTVKGLCSRCLYLKSGKQIQYGDAGRVSERYIADSHVAINEQVGDVVEGLSKNHETSEATVSKETAMVKDIYISLGRTRESFAPGYNEYGNGQVDILDLALFDSHHKRAVTLDLGQSFIIQASLKFNEDLPSFAFGYSFRDLKGQMLVGKMTTNASQRYSNVKKGDTYVVEIAGVNPLKEGIYTVSLGVELPIQENVNHLFLAVVENAVVFKSTFPLDDTKRIAAFVDVPVEFSCHKLS